MINGLGIVGWGVGGIEAEAGMLGQPVYFLTPDVVGVHLTGALREGVTATDLALTVTQMLRKAKVVGKFVEFFGPGAAALPVVDRATIANMAPEYGATMGFFPIDEECVNYLRATGRSDGALSRLYENYYKAQGLWGIPKKGDIAIFAGTRTRSGHRRAERRRAEASAGSHRIAEVEARVSSPRFHKPVTESGFGKKAEELSRTVHVSAGGEVHPRRRQPGAGPQKAWQMPSAANAKWRTNIRRPIRCHGSAPQRERRRSQRLRA